MKKIGKKDLSLDMIKTLLKLYENQEHIKITAKIKNSTTNEEFLYKCDEVTKIIEK